MWDRWHISNPAPEPPTTEEQPLDTITTTPNSMGTGAPFTFSRLHDHIDIGSITLGDPIDELVTDVCDAIDDGLFDLGIIEETEAFDDDDDPDFRAWTKMMSDALRETYSDAPHPENLKDLKIPGGEPHQDGFPTREDIGAAYGAMRLVLKFGTEEKIHEPQPPDILEDLGEILKQLNEDLANDLDSIKPPPRPSFSGSFSLDAMWDSIKKTALWIAETTLAVGKVAFDIVKAEIKAVGTVVSDAIKYVLYLLNKMLFALYRQFRDVLVMAAYSPPYTDELAVDRGTFNTSSLWRSGGDLPAGQYPFEEIPSERDSVGSTYAPFVPPSQLQPPPSTEQPSVGLTAPYKPHIGVDVEFPDPTLPDDFIDAKLGPDDMFTENGPEPPTTSGSLNTFAAEPRNFGGVMANCRRAIELAQQGFPAPFGLPDYNLDGDRGYAWPCWDVQPPPTPSSVPDPLDPTNPANNGTAHVNAVRVSG